MSEIARKLIHECLETQNPYLDLGRCGIKDLNDLPQLAECTHLETLILCDYWWEHDGLKYWRKDSANEGPNNAITSLPPHLKTLTKLTSLVAGGGGLN